MFQAFKGSWTSCSGASQTLDLSARWQVARDWQLQAKLLNATNTDLEPVRDYQGLGRQAWVGLRYQHAGP